MGIRAYLGKLRAVMVADPLPPRAVAAGWALGMFGGCAIPFGLQLIVTVPLAILLKISKTGATIGTLITNPVTIFFIYPAQTWVGCRILGRPLSWDYLSEMGVRLSKVSLFSGAGWRELGDIGGRVLSGYFLGGLLLAAVMTPLTYFLVYKITKARRHV